MTNKEIKEKEELENHLRDNEDLLRYLELYILDNAENIKTRVLAENADPTRELIKIEAIGELRKLLSDELEEE